MQKIVNCLWFDNRCEEAINYYINTFNGAPNVKAKSRIISIQRHEKGFEKPQFH